MIQLLIHCRASARRIVRRLSINRSGPDPNKRVRRRIRISAAMTNSGRVIHSRSVSSVSIQGLWDAPEPAGVFSFWCVWVCAGCRCYCFRAWQSFAVSLAHDWILVDRSVQTPPIRYWGNKLPGQACASWLRTMNDSLRAAVDSFVLSPSASPRPCAPVCRWSAAQDFVAGVIIAKSLFGME